MLNDNMAFQTQIYEARFDYSELTAIANKIGEDYVKQKVTESDYYKYKALIDYYQLLLEAECIKNSLKNKWGVHV